MTLIVLIGYRYARAWDETLTNIKATVTYNPEAAPDSFANRCCYIVEALRAQKMHYQPLYVVHDSSVKAATMFSTYLVEDKSFSMPSYFEFVQTLQHKINK